jgi:hypothetical protein
MQSTKIYGTPLIVARRVKEIVDNSNDVVICTVLERIAIKSQQSDFRIEYGVNEDWHRHHTIVGPIDRGCGCVYCETFHRYVSTKISAHRLRRRIDDYDYMCRPYEGHVDYQHLSLLGEEWVRLRKLKNQIKALTGL